MASSQSSPKPAHERKSIVHDSHLIEHALPPELELTAFQSLEEELRPLWSEMSHKGGAVPRLVCIQADVENDSLGRTTVPLYRHPADEQPPVQRWTPAVQRLRDVASEAIGQELNHALIQMYRGGDDYISEHADKTLDIERGSNIVNLSVGATRTMVLRPKKGGGAAAAAAVEGRPPRPSTRVKMDNASMFVLGWETNRLMTHEIRRDRRDEKFKEDDERAFGGVRISITLRKVATFLRSDGSLFGQGAPKSESPVFRSPVCLEKEEDMLIREFSAENRRTDYDWEELYGKGFSVVNFKITNQHQPQETKD